MKCLVTGASGFIGTRLVARLAQVGATVLAVDIAPARQIVSGVDYIAADVSEPLEAALGRDVNLIYNLAAVHRTPGHPPEEYYRTNVLGALNVTELAERSEVEKILFTSSISIYGPSESLISESRPPMPTSDYGRSKLIAETIHEQWQRRGDARRLVIARPGVVFGPGERGNYTFLAKALRQRAFFYPGRRNAIKGGGYVDELLDTFEFVLSLDQPKVIYNYAFPDASTIEDIVESFHHVAGFPRPMGAVPLPILLAAAFGFEGLAKLGLKTPIHRERVRKLVNSTAVTPHWLLEHGYRFRRDLRKALMEWRQESGGTFT